MRILLFLLVIAGFVFLLLATQPAQLRPGRSLLLPFVNMTIDRAAARVDRGLARRSASCWATSPRLPGRFGAAARARRAEKQLASIETTTA